MSESEAHWIGAARRGDSAAFRRLVENHARPLHRVCTRILGDASAAEDALQEAFLNAWNALDGFDGRSAFGSWLHRIAVNAALGQLRQRRPGLDQAAADEDVDQTAAEGGADPFEHAAGHEWRQRLGLALSGLSAAERSAFVLRHVEQHSLHDISAALGCNVNATKQAIFRAVRKLRGALVPIRSTP